MIKMKGRNQAGQRRAMFRKIPLNQLKVLNQKRGEYWFSSGATRFFKSKYPQTAYEKFGTNRAFFITSEKNPSGERRYSVRKANLQTGEIDTVGAFHGFSKERAKRKLNQILR